jgi:hypothetical protein
MGGWCGHFPAIRTSSLEVPFVALGAVRDISSKLQARDCWLCARSGWFRLRAAAKIVRVAAQRPMPAGSVV